MFHSVLIRSFIAAGLVVAAGSAVGATLTNPAVAPGSIVQWAGAVGAFVPGPQDAGVPGSPPADSGIPANALGAQDGSTVSLGDGGSLTLRFDTAIFDGTGADFAVFENAFAFDGLVFAELAFVAVSTDGIHFASFASIYNNPALNDEFGAGFLLMDINEVNNFAGIHNTGTGTGFDLSELAGDPLVAAGLLDLGAIYFIRVTDVIGDGSTSDSFGRAIIDPYPTAFASSGFDLDAIGAIHVVPLPPALVLMAGALGFIGGASRRRARRI